MTSNEAQKLCDAPLLHPAVPHDYTLADARDLIARLPAKDADTVRELMERLERHEESAAKFAAAYIAEQKETAVLVGALDEWREAFEAYLDDDDAALEDIVEPCETLSSVYEDYIAPEVMYDNAEDCAESILDWGW